jgi:hypothetical protein
MTNVRVGFLADTGPDGLPIWYGFDIRNSEMGLYSLCLRAMIWRLVCTNGMIVADSLGDSRWRHIGDPERLRDAFMDGLPSVIDSAVSQRVRLQAAHNEPLALPAVKQEIDWLDLTKGESKVALVQSLAEADIVDPKQEVVIDDIDPKTEITRWHLINGVTASAREAVAPRRLHIETQAGRLLTRTAA